MEPVIIIAIAFVLLIPISVFAQDDTQQSASQQATIETIEKFGPEGQIIETSEYDGIFRAEVLIKGGYEGDEDEIITYFEIVDGYVKAHNLGVEGQLYQYDDVVGAILLETIFGCYDCVEGPKIRTGDCFGYLAFVRALDAPRTQINFGELQCTGTDSVTFEGVWIAALGEEIDNEGPQGNGGCLIATATYGSELAPQVQQLREIRDNTLLQTESGRSFMESFNQFYYSFSPGIADLERENPVFKEAVKLTITPLLTSLSILNYVDIDSEETVLGYGISLIILNVGMYFVAPALVVIRIFRINI